jgi:hypothetical protein
MVMRIVRRPKRSRQRNDDTGIWAPHGVALLVRQRLELRGSRGRQQQCAAAGKRQ